MADDQTITSDSGEPLLTRREIIGRGWTRNWIKRLLTADRYVTVGGETLAYYVLSHVVSVEGREPFLTLSAQRRAAEEEAEFSRMRRDAKRRRGVPSAETAGEVAAAYFGSSGAASRSVCSRLSKLGPLGVIAAELYRTQKASSRAKAYGVAAVSEDGPTYRSLAYGRKSDAIKRLSATLCEQQHGLTWGWGVDPRQPLAAHVLYIDLPQGQVSFHTRERYDGPDYPGDWDKQHESERRVVVFCESLIAGCAPDGEM